MPAVAAPSFTPAAAVALPSAVPATFAAQAATAGVCQCPANTSGASLAELTALKLKTQELDARASAVVAAAMTESAQVHQMAAQALVGRASSDSKSTTQGATTTPAATTASTDATSLATQVRELTQRVDRLSVSVSKIADHLSREQK
jgi:hypothetical protein